MTIDYDVIDDYLANRLSEEQLESFEIEMLDSSELQEAVLAQRALKDGLAHANIQAKKKGVVSNLPRFLSSPTWAYAATILLGLSVSYNWIQTDTSSANTQIDRITYIETLRSSTSPTYTIKASEGNLLVVDVNPNSTGPYQISIHSGKEIFHQQSIAHATDYSLNIIAPALEQGDYTLAISDEMSEMQYQISVLE